MRGQAGGQTELSGLSRPGVALTRSWIDAFLQACSFDPSSFSRRVPEAMIDQLRRLETDTRPCSRAYLQYAPFRHIDLNEYSPSPNREAFRYH